MNSTEIDAKGRPIVKVDYVAKSIGLKEKSGVKTFGPFDKVISVFKFVDLFWQRIYLFLWGESFLCSSSIITLLLIGRGPLENLFLPKIFQES
jgi:hypothetical protein